MAGKYSPEEAKRRQLETLAKHRVKTQFKSGPDPRRFDFVAAGKVFQEANTAALKHGLTRRTAVERLPDRYQVRLPAALTAEQIVENLSVLRDMTSDILEVLSQSENPANIEAVGQYAQLASRIADTLASIEGGDLARGKYGKLSLERVQEMKLRYARDISNALTKLKHAYDWGFNEFYATQPEGTDLVDILEGIGGPQIRFFDEHGLARPTYTKGFAATIAGARSILEKWARLLQWEAQVSGDTHDMMKEYVDAIKRR